MVIVDVTRVTSDQELGNLLISASVIPTGHESSSPSLARVITRSADAIVRLAAAKTVGDPFRIIEAELFPILRANGFTTKMLYGSDKVRAPGWEKHILQLMRAQGEGEFHVDQSLMRKDGSGMTPLTLSVLKKQKNNKQLKGTPLHIMTKLAAINETDQNVVNAKMANLIVAAADGIRVPHEHQVFTCADMYSLFREGIVSGSDDNRLRPIIPVPLIVCIGHSQLGHMSRAEKSINDILKYLEYSSDGWEGTRDITDDNRRDLAISSQLKLMMEHPDYADAAIDAIAHSTFSMNKSLIMPMIVYDKKSYGGKPLQGHIEWICLSAFSQLMGPNAVRRAMGVYNINAWSKFMLDSIRDNSKAINSNWIDWTKSQNDRTKDRKRISGSAKKGKATDPFVRDSEKSLIVSNVKDPAAIHRQLEGLVKEYPVSHSIWKVDTPELAKRLGRKRHIKSVKGTYSLVGISLKEIQNRIKSRESVESAISIVDKELGV